MKFRVKKKNVAKIVGTTVPFATVLDYAYALGVNALPVYMKGINNFDQLPALQDEVLNEWLLDPVHVIAAASTNPAFLVGQLPFLGLTLAFVAKGLWDKREHNLEDASKYGAHGTARWAKRREIMNPENVHTGLNSDGAILGMYKKTEILQHNKTKLNKNRLVIGGSGSAKTQAYVIPNILHTKDKSIVVTDPKGELYEKTAQTKREQGYDVRVLNFKDLDHSDRYNPFDYIRKETDALKAAKTIIMNSGGDGEKKLKGDFWDKAEQALLSAFILYIKYHTPKEQHHFGSIFNLVTMPYKDIHTMFRNLPENDIGRKAYGQAIEKLEDKVRANVFISLAVSLDLWKYQEVCKFTYTSDFSLRDIGQRKIALYIIIPIAEDTFTPLISTCLDQMFLELYDLANYHYNKLPVGVCFLLDEFPNIGRIPKFGERLSTTRSYGIEVSPIIQSIGQLREIYGKERTDEIIDNCDVRLFLGSNSVDSAKYFSDMIGKTTKTIRNDSKSKGKNDTEGNSFNVISRPLMTADEVLRLDTNKLLVFLKGQQPMLLNKAFAFKNPTFRKATENVVSRYDYPVADRSYYSEFKYDLVTNFFSTLNEQIPKNVDQETGEILFDTDEETKEENEELSTEENPLKRLLVKDSEKTPTHPVTAKKAKQDEEDDDDLLLTEDETEEEYEPLEF